MVSSLPAPTLAVGRRVLVRCSFDGRWAPGFVVSAVLEDTGPPRIRVTRVSDSSEIPHVFAIDDVRLDA